MFLLVDFLLLVNEDGRDIYDYVVEEPVLAPVPIMSIGTWGTAILQSLADCRSGSPACTTVGRWSLDSTTAGFEFARTIDVSSTKLGDESAGGGRLCRRAGDWGPTEGGEVSGGGRIDSVWEMYRRGWMCTRPWAT